MGNFIAKDGAGDAKYFNSTGTGTDIDPFIPVKSLAAGTALIGNVGIDQATANANEVVVKSITAGDTNIGNVDIVTVPAPLSVVGTGTEAAAMRVTIASDSTGVLSVDDNGGALTVDGAVTADITKVAGESIQVAGGTEAKSIRVTIASDSTGLLSVDDNGGALTVDGTVTVGAITAGETHIGAVGGHTISVTVTPTLSVNATYIANDYVGTDHTPMSFTLARVNDGSGTIVGAMLCSKVVVTGSYELWLFNTTLDPGHDSDAWTITDAEQLTCIGVIPFSTWYANANGAVSMGSIGSGFPFVCIGTAKVIYACLVTRATVAWEADGDVSVKLWAIQD